MNENVLSTYFGRCVTNKVVFDSPLFKSTWLVNCHLKPEFTFSLIDSNLAWQKGRWKRKIFKVKKKIQIVAVSAFMSLKAVVSGWLYKDDNLTIARRKGQTRTHTHFQNVCGWVWERESESVSKRNKSFKAWLGDDILSCGQVY
jgi:hypothetical protein